jgi:hypothetical protein
VRDQGEKGGTNAQEEQPEGEDRHQGRRPGRDEPQPRGPVVPGGGAGESARRRPPIPRLPHVFFGYLVLAAVVLAEGWAASLLWRWSLVPAGFRDLGLRGGVGLAVLTTTLLPEARGGVAEVDRVTVRTLAVAGIRKGVFVFLSLSLGWLVLHGPGVL